MTGALTCRASLLTRAIPGRCDQAAAAMLEEGSFSEMADFDDHLASPARDWLNKDLLARLA